MKRLVVDASVVIKLYLSEEHSAEARAHLAPPCTLRAPDLLHPEVGNVLWKKIRRREITEPLARRALRSIRRAPVRIAPCGPLLARAFDLSVETGRSVYDCTYLALAIRSGARLVTADRKLFEALKDGPYSLNLQWVAETA